jgi:hypothetical protein
MLHVQLFNADGTGTLGRIRPDGQATLKGSDCIRWLVKTHAIGSS